MRFLTPLSILVAGLLIAGALLAQERYRVWEVGQGAYLVHDGWSGALTSCSLNGTPPEVAVACREVSGSTR